MALWFFQRTAPGEIRRISNPSMQRFLVGERSLRHDGDRFVRCIGMSVELRNRRPYHVGRVWFSKIRVRDDGRVDPHHRSETIHLAQTEAHAVVAHGPSVVAAGHRFARRRLSHLAEWQPDERDIDALRAIVNANAGRVVL